MISFLGKRISAYLYKVRAVIADEYFHPFAHGSSSCLSLISFNQSEINRIIFFIKYSVSDILCQYFRRDTAEVCMNDQNHGIGFIYFGDRISSKNAIKLDVKSSLESSGKEENPGIFPIGKHSGTFQMDDPVKNRELSGKLMLCRQSRTVPFSL